MFALQSPVRSPSPLYAPSNDRGAGIAAIPTPSFQTRSTLDIARANLENTDRDFAQLLQPFQRAATVKQKPTLADLQKIRLPKSIEDLALYTNTPRELFTGTLQFMALEEENGSLYSTISGRDKTKEFQSACEKLCERHNYSRMVYAHKNENFDSFKGEDGRVNTFISVQHDKVVQRIESFCVIGGADPTLGGIIIDWVASANAGWQDMAINDKTGPFVIPVRDNNPSEMRYPAAWIPYLG